MPARFLNVYDDERGKFSIEFNRGLPFLHFSVRLPMQAMRDAKRLFPQVLAWLRSVGHHVVCVLIPEGDEKLYRFVHIFGFREIKRIRGHVQLFRRI